jgi:hypothetical protein
MKDHKFKPGVRFKRIIGGLAILMILGSAIAGCSAFDPQGAAQQWAPNYYNQDYASLSTQQKMQLEDHLSNQSNQAWKTSADVASGLGRLVQGTGVLLFAAKH